ncbi:hypothetical protein [Salinimicrobium flavum]|uniref:GLPGLI family protein n=1 Tax=Salinimicrobium flavum TaxID=1737065 RepID=A0ABW5IZN3_9FLAO
MKRAFLIITFLLFSLAGFSQELATGEGFYIGTLEVRPSLSYLAPQIPEGNFTLTEVIFKKEVKREVNLVAMMERTRYEQESSYIELESPMPYLGKTEAGFIQITNQVRVHDRGSNYDIYTGKTKIPAYKEMRAGLFTGNYSPYTGRSYISPYSYSPFLR